MTHKERLEAQKQLGTCEVIQYNTSEESNKITEDLTSKDLTYAGHTLVNDQIKQSGGATIIVAKNATGINSGGLSNAAVEDLKALIIDKVRKSEKNTHHSLKEILLYLF